MSTWSRVYEKSIQDFYPSLKLLNVQSSSHVVWETVPGHEATADERVLRLLQPRDQKIQVSPGRGARAHT